jgi:hypothetical protein
MDLINFEWAPRLLTNFYADMGEFSAGILNNLLIKFVLGCDVLINASQKFSLKSALDVKKLSILPPLPKIIWIKNWGYFQDPNQLFIDTYYSRIRLVATKYFYLKKEELVTWDEQRTIRPLFCRFMLATTHWVGITLPMKFRFIMSSNWDGGMSSKHPHTDVPRVTISQTSTSVVILHT